VKQKPEQTQMPQEQQLRMDYRKRMLCAACWNNAHFTFKRTKTGKRTSQKILNCEQGGCQCPCRELFKEEQERNRARQLARAS
jgi:hypothetical protein